MSRLTRFLCGAVIGLTSACSEATGLGVADERFDGVWRYQASIAGSTTNIQGTLTVTGADNGRLSGTLSAEQVEVSGQRTQISGLIAGTVVSTGVAEMNLTLPGGVVRTHFTQMRNDSLIGDWSERNGTTAGAFRAGRAAP